MAATASTGGSRRRAEPWSTSTWTEGPNGGTSSACGTDGPAEDVRGRETHHVARFLAMRFSRTFDDVLRNRIHLSILRVMEEMLERFQVPAREEERRAS